MWSAIINIILGLWVMLAPALLGIAKPAADFNYITGPIVLSCAIIAIWEVNRSARYINMVAGIALALSPVVLETGSEMASWSNALAGLLIAISSWFKGRIKGRYGGGWKSLFVKDPLHWREAGKP